MAMIHDSQETDNQFNVGIKIIQSAFFNQLSFFQREMSLLNQEIQNKNEKINELEQANIGLVSEKEDYENTMQNLMAENNRLTQLLDNKHNVPKKNNQTIEKEYSIRPLIENEISNLSTLLNTTKHNLKMNRSASNLLIKTKSQSNNITNIDQLLAGFDETITKIKKYNNNNNNSGNTINQLKKSPSFVINKDKRTSYKKTTQQITEEDQPINDNINTYTINNNVDSNQRGFYNNQNEFPSKKGDFFKKCRSIMTSQDYSQMLEVIRLANNYQITKEETYDRISYLLEKKYQHLLAGFEELIFQKR